LPLRWRKAKIPISVAPLYGIFATLRQATGYFEIFAATFRAAAPHFLLKKDFIFHLNSSRAASCGEFKYFVFLFEIYADILIDEFVKTEFITF
jgi:hypothetical protein